MVRIVWKHEHQPSYRNHTVNILFKTKIQCKKNKYCDSSLPPKISPPSSSGTILTCSLVAGWDGAEEEVPVLEYLITPWDSPEPCLSSHVETNWSVRLDPWISKAEQNFLRICNEHKTWAEINLVILSHREYQVISYSEQKSILTDSNVI